MPIMLMGSTLSMLLSTVSIEPSGIARRKFGHVVDVGCVHAAADRHPVHHQRALVDAAADQSLHRFVAVDVVELERALDAGGAQADGCALR
jgi:hypothetical protein